MSFFSGKSRIYADWAATTPLHPQVVKAMEEARKNWANPSSIYEEGVEAKKTLEEKRSDCARLLGVKPEEVYFTSGGTEANGTIIQGVLRTKLEKGEKDVHVVTTSIEHSSILEVLKLFESHGVKVTYVKPKEDGVVNVDDILAAITPQTALVTVMYANNEIGTIQPVSKIGAGIRKIRAQKIGHKDVNLPVFHVDASQAPLWLSCDIEGMRADAMTLDAHKMQGPKGIGALVVRRHVSFEPLMIGGGQERGMRPTTESLELVAGFAEALKIAQAERETRSSAAEKIQKLLIEKIEKEVPEAILNGSISKRLPNNVHISIKNISDPEYAVLFLDKEGIACSTKSSCLKGEENSYVVASLGKESWVSRNTMRFSFAPNATSNNVYKIVEALKRLPRS
jgi:cysteine desulfurase